jgi:hypothetical protein
MMIKVYFKWKKMTEPGTIYKENMEPLNAKRRNTMMKKKYFIFNYLEGE